jgi:hypothetical protein
MFGLGYLFFPWGFIVQILALVHLVRRRSDSFWFWVILLGGFVGAAAYILVEVLPDAGLLRDSFQTFGRRSRIQNLENVILDNPSAGNYEDLAELYWEQKQYAQAREAYDHAIAARSDSIHAFYHRALCALALGDFAGALPDLERVVHHDSKFDYYRAPALLAHAYSMTGRKEQAESLFAGVLPFSTIPETLYNYACFLKSQNRLAEARQWAQTLVDKKRTMPRFVERRERPWLIKGKALLKELPVS